jgi:hypothetical protein
MRNGGLIIVGLVLTALIFGCSPGANDVYTLRGTPAERSGTNSGNFVIAGDKCSYVTMTGFYTADATVTTYPCKVVADEADALGDPHTHVTITISTAKGDQTAKIDGTTAGMIASQSPNLSYPFPPNWAVSPPAQPLTLHNSDNGATQVQVQVAGVECAITINKSPVACGMSYWSDNSLSVWLPGLLVSATYAQYVIPLNFGKGPTGQWTLNRAPEGFPTTYVEMVSDASKQ